MGTKSTDRAWGLTGKNPAIVRWGLRSWLFVGIALAVVVVGSALGQISGLVVPLVLASVLAALFAPFVDLMQKWGLPRQVGSLVVLFLLFGAISISFLLLVRGVVDQGSQIYDQLFAGVDSVTNWLDEQGFEGVTSAEVEDGLNGAGRDWLGGAMSQLPGLFSGLASAAVGVMIGTFLLYYIVLDWNRLISWTGSHLGFDRETGVGIIDDTVQATRIYFLNLTISAAVTAVIIGVTALILDVPLAFTIALVTLVTSYIPYLGAILSGAFATLVALGSQGLTAALILLAVVLIVQNIVQTVVTTKLTSNALKLHPIVTLGSTIVGAALAGALGATLSAPVIAAAIQINKRLNGALAAESEDEDSAHSLM